MGILWGTATPRIVRLPRRHFRGIFEDPAMGDALSAAVDDCQPIRDALPYEATLAPLINNFDSLRPEAATIHDLVRLPDLSPDDCGTAGNLLRLAATSNGVRNAMWPPCPAKTTPHVRRFALRPVGERMSMAEAMECVPVAADVFPLDLVLWRQIADPPPHGWTHEPSDGGRGH